MSKAFALNRATDRKEMSDLIKGMWPQGSDNRRILDAYKELKEHGFNLNRVTELFRNKAKRIDGFEKDILRALAAERARKVREANDEITELRARLSRLEAALSVADPDFHRPQIEAVRGSVRGLGGVVGARSEGVRE